MKNEVTEEMLQEHFAVLNEQKMLKELRELVKSILLNTRPYNENWEFPKGAKVEAIHQKLRHMLGIQEDEWRKKISNDQDE
jgi:hypothetical protein